MAPDAEILRRLAPVRDGLARLAESFRYGGLVRSGETLAIVARPNVGKSSLFNRLLEQDRAIITDIPGTTRDLVTETASIGGIPVKLCDTAGIRESTELVESLGIERSYQGDAAADADLTIVVDRPSAQFLEATDRDLMAKARAQGRWLLAGNKYDLSKAPVEDAIPVSALTGEGIDSLREAILDAIRPKEGFEQESGFITSLRHERLLRDAVRSASTRPAAR